MKETKEVMQCENMLKAAIVDYTVYGHYCPTSIFGDVLDYLNAIVKLKAALNVKMDLNNIKEWETLLYYVKHDFYQMSNEVNEEVKKELKEKYKWLNP